MQKLHKCFLKSMLGIRESTADAIVLAELGRFPLQFYWWELALGSTQPYDEIAGISELCLS